MHTHVTCLPTLHLSFSPSLTVALHPACQHFIIGTWKKAISFFTSLPFCCSKAGNKQCSGSSSNHSQLLNKIHPALLLVSISAFYFFVWGRDYAPGQRAMQQRGGGLKMEKERVGVEGKGEGALWISHCSNHRCFFNTSPCWRCWGNEEKGSPFPTPFHNFRFFLPPGLLPIIKISLHFRVRQFYLHFATYGASLFPTCLSPCTQRPLPQYILHKPLPGSSKIKNRSQERLHWSPVAAFTQWTQD